MFFCKKIPKDSLIPWKSLRLDLFLRQLGLKRMRRDPGEPVALNQGLEEVPVASCSGNLHLHNQNKCEFISTYSPTSNEWKVKPKLTGGVFSCFNSVHQAKELHPGLSVALHLVLTSLYLIHPATPYLPAASQQLHIMIVSTNCRNYGLIITINTRQGSLSSSLYLPLSPFKPLHPSLPPLPLSVV